MDDNVDEDNMLQGQRSESTEKCLPRTVNRVTGVVNFVLTEPKSINYWRH
jgi:hypothetical protein